MATSFPAPEVAAKHQVRGLAHAHVNQPKKVPGADEGEIVSCLLKRGHRGLALAERFGQIDAEHL